MSEVKYLDKTGLGTVWGKVKALVSPKADKSEMSVTPGTGSDADKVTIQLKDGMTATVLTQHQDITGKMDKVDGATAGHIAKLNASGQVVDGGDTVPYAENLVAPVVQDAEFVYRKTGGNLDVDGKGGAASIQKVKGLTRVWNQLNNISLPSYYIGGMTLSMTNCSFSVTGTAAVGASLTLPIKEFTHGHKCLVRISKELPAGICAGFYGGNSGPRRDSYIYELTSSNDFFYLCLYEDNLTIGQEYNVSANVFIHDLTLLFNGNVPENFTVEDFERMFPEPYHDYTPGVLINNDAEGIETVGFNLLDVNKIEDTEYGKVSVDGDIITLYQTIYAYYVIINDNNLKDIPVGTWLYFDAQVLSKVGTTGEPNITFFHDDGTYDRAGIGSRLQITKPIRNVTLYFGGGESNVEVKLSNIVLNISSSRNGEYEPYWKKELHLGLNAIRVKSPNIWDEQWEMATAADGNLWGDVNGKLAKGVVPAYGPNLESKELIPCLPNTTYYLRYPGQSSVFDSGYAAVLFADADMNYLGRGTSSGSTVVSPQNAAYMAFFVTTTYGSTYNHDIMINLSDPGFNGKYYPYGVLTFEGLNGVGDVKDEIADGKLVRKMGEVDLGELTWGYAAHITGGSNDKSGFYAYANPGDMKEEGADVVPNAVCGRYPISYINYIYVGNIDKALSYSYGFTIRVVDSGAGTDASAFKAAMSGVLLRYELANPETFELVEPLDLDYEVDGSGTERRLPEDTASFVHAPFCAEITYALNGSETLANLDKNYVRNDNIAQETGNDKDKPISQDAVTRELGILSQRIAMTDLSFIDPTTGVGLFTRNTANCYVVRTPGNYMFPLVYGNAIKNGKANPAAYTRIVSDYTAEFVNHLGNNITNPFIERNAGCNPFSATLLWQTGQGLIPSVSLVQGADCLYVRFTVASVPANNGNAIIGVKDVNGDIMWSWHIWLTKDDLTPEEIENHTGVKYYMMPEAIGTMWDDRANKLGYNLFYQHGRKDAVGLPAAYNDGTMHALYDIDGNSVTVDTYGVADDGDAGGTVRSVANSIKMPHKFFLEYDNSKYNWNNLPWFNNFWNAALTASSELADNQMTAIKTIYDPSPVGFMLPGPRAWTGFTTTGSNTSTAGEFNVVGSSSDGWNFKRNSADAVGTKYCASGCRYRTSGGLNNVGSSGYFWSFAPNSQTNARNLDFSSGYVSPLDIGGRASGFSVRPSIEY